MTKAKILESYDIWNQQCNCNWPLKSILILISRLFTLSDARFVATRLEMEFHVGRILTALVTHILYTLSAGKTSAHDLGTAEDIIGMEICLLSYVQRT